MELISNDQKRLLNGFCSSPIISIDVYRIYSQKIYKARRLRKFLFSKYGILNKPFLNRMLRSLFYPNYNSYNLPEFIHKRLDERT